MIPEAAVEAAAGCDTEPMDISDDAVKAAFFALYKVAGRGGVGKDEIRIMLEAAAPHIAAKTLLDAADALKDAAEWSTPNPEFEKIQRWLRSRAEASTHS